MTENKRWEIPILIKTSIIGKNNDNNKQLYDDLIKGFYQSIEKAEQQLIQTVAKELNTNEKCAEKYIKKYFIVEIETQNPNSMLETPEFYLTIKPKPVEQVVFDGIELDNGCGKRFFIDDSLLNIVDTETSKSICCDDPVDAEECCGLLNELCHEVLDKQIQIDFLKSKIKAMKKSIINLKNNK